MISEDTPYPQTLDLDKLGRDTILLIKKCKITIKKFRKIGAKCHFLVKQHFCEKRFCLSGFQTMGVFLFPFIPSSCWQSWTSRKYGMHITTIKKLVFAIFYGHSIIPCSKLLRNGKISKHNLYKSIA